MAPLSSAIASTATLNRNIVRSSRFRHVYGEPAKRTDCYENINITRSAHDSNFCAVNPKFLAFVIECVGGGAFAVLPLNLTGRLQSSQIPTCNGHRAPCTDLKWNPFNDNVLASASEDGSAKLWYIPDDLTAAQYRPTLGIFETPSVSANFISSKKSANSAIVNTVLASLQPLVTLEGHSRRILYIEWHPTASDVLVTVGADHLVIVWDVGVQSAVRVIDSHPDTIYSLAWNWYGSTLATTCKDKQLRLIEPRSNNVIGSTQCHAGPKATKCLQMGRKIEQQILTTGFSRYSDREFAIWDCRMLNTNDTNGENDEAGSSNALRIQTIDSSSGICMPYYDADLSMLYIAGKGDGTIRYYEISHSSAHYLSQYQTSLPQRSLGVMPKRGLDTGRCEIWRFYKLHASKNLIEPISMIVPRRTMPANVFNSLNSSGGSGLGAWSDDLYPPTPGPTAALSADEWTGGSGGGGGEVGRSESPVLISLKPCSNSNFGTSPAISNAAPRNPIAATLLNENKTLSTSPLPPSSTARLAADASTSPPSTNGAEFCAAAENPVFASPFGGAFNNPFLMMPSSSNSSHTKRLMNTTNKPIFRREGTAESSSSFMMTTCDPNQERKFKWLVDTKAPDYRAAPAAAAAARARPLPPPPLPPSILVKSPESLKIGDAAVANYADIDDDVVVDDDDDDDDGVHSQSGSVLTVVTRNFENLAENENFPIEAAEKFAASPPPIDQFNNTATMDFDYLQGQHLSAPPRIGDDIGSNDEFLLRRDSWCINTNTTGATVQPQQTFSASPSRTLQTTAAVGVPPDSTTLQTLKQKNGRFVKKSSSSSKKKPKKISIEDEPPSVGATSSSTAGDINSKFSFTNDDAALLTGNGPSTPSEATPSPTQALVCGFDYIVDAEHLNHQQQQLKQAVAVLSAKISTVNNNCTSTAAAAAAAADELVDIVRRVCTTATSRESPHNSDSIEDDDEQFPCVVEKVENFVEEEKIQRQCEQISGLKADLREREQYIAQLETIIRCCAAAAAAAAAASAAANVAAPVSAGDGEDENDNDDDDDDDVGVENLVDAVRRYTDSAMRKC